MVDIFAAGTARCHQLASSEDNHLTLPDDNPLVPMPIEEEPHQPALQYGCPYRKRNPGLFDVCDFHSCAHSSFNTISEVRQHIIEAHQSKDFPSQCPTCNAWFRSDTARDDHLGDKKCFDSFPMIIDDYDRGISEATAAKLESGQAEEGMAAWEHLWCMIFPGRETPMTPDFEPPTPFYHNVGAASQTYPQDSNPSSLAGETGSSCTESDANSLASETGSAEAEGDTQCVLSPDTVNTALMRRVVLATIQIERLSLSDESRRREHDADDSLGQSADEPGSERFGFELDLTASEVQESDRLPESVPTTTTTQNAPQSQTSAPTEQQAWPLRRNRSSEEDDDENDNNRQGKRPRQGSQGTMVPKLLFACPYQAAGLTQDCSKPSRRKPRGGYGTISRLKQHFTRRHRPSYRCQRCWKHCNVQREAQTHPESNCVQNEMPSYEYFMTLEQETEVDRCGGKQPEDTWWKLFRLLIPPIDQMLVSSCYYDNIPTSSNLSSEQPHAQSSGQASGNEATPTLLGSPSDAFPELVSAPILGAGATQPVQDPSFNDLFPELMAFPPYHESYEPGPVIPAETANLSALPNSYSLNPACSSTLNMTQLRRNYDLLEKQAKITDLENSELRKTIETCREEVKLAREVLQTVLDMGNLDSAIGEQLYCVAAILISAGGNLR
ncbi:hypothetical protein MRS44_004163 [Fusarium solani]|uniref:uncharacterized protein n=1 Tax=Fusarium solani TaxID=169388 RepID=UPI0032C4A6A1|nr:hypothetical protein MRS44_004163 [Fusarium solani]